MEDENRKIEKIKLKPNVPNIKIECYRCGALTVADGVERCIGMCGDDDNCEWDDRWEEDES